MNRAFSGLSQTKRLVLSIGIIALVHLTLLRFGNENATPLRILGSFALSTTLILVANRIRQHLLSVTAPAAAALSPDHRDAQ